MKINKKNTSLTIFGLNKKEEVMNQQENLNSIIDNIFIPNLSRPLQNNNVSLLKNNIKFIYNDFINLNNYKFKNLQSTKLIYTIVQAVNTIINLTNLADSLEASNSILLDTINSQNSQTNAILTSIAKTNASIEQAYLIYIQRFGIPIDGIFDLIKIDEIRSEIKLFSIQYNV